MASKKKPQRKRRLFGKDLQDTAFSEPRLIIWGLHINLLVLVIGLIALRWADKDAMPLGTLAGAIVGYFTAQGSQKVRDRCGVCNSAAVPHSPEQCISILKAKAETGSKL